MSDVYLSVFGCNIRSVSANNYNKNYFYELNLFLKNDIHCNTLDLIILTEIWHNVVFIKFSVTFYIFRNLKGIKMME